MTWLLVFLYNLRTPVAMVSAVIVMACVLTVLHGLQVRQSTKFADPDNTDAKWRQITAIQLAIIAMVFAGIIWAIPSPEYDVRYRDRVVVKRVNVPGPIRYAGIKTVIRPPTYNETYRQCVDTLDESVYDEEAKVCHQQAMEAIRPVGPAPTVVYRVKWKHDSYKDLFDACNDFDISDKNSNPGVIRNERLIICQKIALEGSRDR